MKSRKKQLRLWALCISLLLMFTAGCSNTNAPGPEASPSAPVSGEVENGKEIVLAAYRNTAPGEKDAYYCSSILYVW